MSERRTPIRRCVGCMTSYPRDEVVRLAASDGNLFIDRSGAADGRGAYLCRSMECFDAAVKKKRFARALGVSLTPETSAGLRAEYAKEIGSAEVTE